MDAIIVTNASANEIAALVRATQERQPEENFTPSDVIKRVAPVTIRFSGSINRLTEILRAKDDTEPELPGKPSN